MIDIYMFNSKNKIEEMNESERKTLVSNIKDFFKLDSEVTELTTENVYNYLWSNDPIISDGGIFNFCHKFNLTEENEKYKSEEEIAEDNYIANIKHRMTFIDQALSLQEIDKINTTPSLIFKAIDAGLFSIKDIYQPTEEMTNRVIHNSFRSIFFINQPSQNNISEAISAMFKVYLKSSSEEERNYFSHELNLLFKRAEYNQFNTETYKYSFRNKEEKKFFQEQISQDFKYSKVFN